MIPAMGPEKDEILRNAKKMAEQEKRIRDTIIREKAPVKLRSRMPIGCWIWLAAIAFAIYMLFRKYLDGL